MRARIILNEIKRDGEYGGLGSIGVGHINKIKGYLELKKRMTLIDSYKITNKNDIKKTNLPYDEIVITHILDSLNCNVDDLIIFNQNDIDAKLYNYIDDIMFYRWRIDKDNDYIKLQYAPDKIFNEGEKKEYTVILNCHTSTDWNMSQVVMFKNFTKTFERTGYTTYVIRYK